MSEEKKPLEGRSRDHRRDAEGMVLVSVYVDPLLDWPITPVWRFGAVSHLYADTPEELHEFARRLGMKRTWCSDHAQPGSRLLHYDLSPGKRALAVKLGAVEVSHEHGRAFYRSIEVRKAEVDARRR